ncbi:helix-turn-helix domain-containing protein [Clostridium botulinum]|uniref:helix-turn-helix domain-containing protein n=1 Tax=Clostridium botulinum TaxID=1491 RepID=UPI001E2C1C54|nr:LysR family transcriptional regulator [Clostridium botulinum]MCD3254358.1 ArsR family transcriptional regulator [Clostridium botulinum C/D]MCD3279858.1 ArsR family transcriptional regulator [Clostridium botulinum C/D]MCD3339589.1 ArsR family transcriptional regulator [Clostridium botulinum C/D]MCD3357497.1 ArsR family transcriptional regulator [Clostridium botulinum C/D]
MIKGIYVKKFEDENVIFFNADFIKQYSLKPNEIEFLQYFVPMQVSKGNDEWVILKIEETAEKLNIARPSLSRYLKKMEEQNILIHEDFRSTLWKINPSILICVD